MGAAIGGGVVVAIGVCVVAAVVGIFIYENSAAPCECATKDQLCSCPNDQPCSCPDIAYYMKVPLIATHLIPFVLMPASMWVCQARAGELKKMGMKSPEQVVLGLAYIMVSIAGEVSWHVHQRWFYQEQYDVFNFFFYAFITLGTSFWALGAQSTEATKYSSLLDTLLMLCTPLTALTYALGAYVIKHDLDYPASKVPIYIIMSYQYALLSWRLFKLLNDCKVWRLPFFSVGVNLFFVFLLSQCTSTDCDHLERNLILNPIFHILHDALGTEMGVLLITLVIWSDTSSPDSKQSS